MGTCEKSCVRFFSMHEITITVNVNVTFNKLLISQNIG